MLTREVVSLSYLYCFEKYLRICVHFLDIFQNIGQLIFARSRRFILRTGRSGGRLQSSSGGVRSLLWGAGIYVATHKEVGVRD